MKNAENRSSGVACLVMTRQECRTNCPSFSTAEINHTKNDVSLQAIKQTFEKSSPLRREEIIYDALKHNLNGDTRLCANPVFVAPIKPQNINQELFNSKGRRRYKRR